ncbi:hypothetical protein [Streptomyces pactum]|uniref:hypothetical protein n=1 Tax=Streptomyces pactum TaxID=68249 RepID=UPI0036F55857
MDLVGEIAAVRAGAGQPETMVGEFRRTAVLVPLVGGAPMSGRLGGIRWIYAFTGEPSLARFLTARDPDAAGREWGYRRILGARLLDVVVPALEEPAGVALDIADEDGSMLLPPARGIVPDAAALDPTVLRAAPSTAGTVPGTPPPAAYLRGLSPVTTTRGEGHR